MSEPYDPRSAERIQETHEMISMNQEHEENDSDNPYDGTGKPDSSLRTKTVSDTATRQGRLPDEGSRKDEDSEENESSEEDEDSGEESESNEEPEKQATNTGQKPRISGPEDDIPVPGREDAAGKQKAGKENTQTDIDKTGGWVKVYNEYKSIDEDWVDQTDKFIDTLLVFAGLFSAVLTAFLVQVYTELQPDNVEHSALILLDLSNQLHALSLGQVALPSNVSLTSVDQSKSLVATTSLWFVSLILSLGAALFGILVKQWLREYMRWTSIFPLQHAIHVREYRNHDLKNWHVEGIVTIISECLEVGLVLFFVGLGVLLWRINATAAQVTTAFVGLVLLAATITTALPIFVLRCPYRTSLGSLMLNALVLLRRILLPVRVAISSVVQCFSLWNRYRNPWWNITRMPNRFLFEWGRQMDKTWGESRDTLPLLFTNWIKSDRMFRLPQVFDQSMFDRLTSLSWLINHRNVPENLVGQCLSDLPGTPVFVLENERNKEWTPTNEAGRQSQQFTVHCQALLSFMHSEDLGAEPKDILNLEKLLVMLLPDRSQDTDKVSLPRAYENIDIYDFSRAIQRADKQSHNTLSEYFLSLANTLLGSEQFLSRDTNFHLVRKLLCLLILLWYESDYRQAQRNVDFGNIDLGTDPSTKSFSLLQQVFDQLLAQSPQNANPDSLARYNSIIDLLANHFEHPNVVRYPGGSFISAPFDEKPCRDASVVKVMKAAIHFVEYNRGLSPLPDNADRQYHTSLDSVDRWRRIPWSDEDTRQYMHTSKDNRPSNVQKLPDIFWDLTRPVFNSDVKKHHNIPHQEHNAFLEAVRTVLQAEIRTSHRWEDNTEHKRYFIIPYILRHRSHLSKAFVSTLKEADAKHIISVQLLVSEFWRWKSNSSFPRRDHRSWFANDPPDAMHGIRHASEFWKALESPMERIRHSPP